MLELLINYLKKKEFINSTDKNGQTALFYAIKNSNGSPLIKLLLSNTYLNPQQPDKVNQKDLRFLKKKKVFSLQSY
jgi:ankyrin repeat protein